MKLLDKTKQFKGKRREHVEQILHDELKKTYLGEMLEEVASRLGGASETTETAEEIEMAEEVVEP